MGATPTAIPAATFVRPCSSETYIPLESTRLNGQRSSPALQSSRFGHRGPILQTGFAALWSIAHSDTLGPSPRTGHFCCPDDASGGVYIGHGLSRSRPLFDLWHLDVRSYRWRQIPLQGAALCGRSGTAGALAGERLLLFGGYCAPHYLGELHAINVVSGEVSVIETRGAAPSPRSSPIVAVHGGFLFVWGGFNGDWPSELSVLDLADMTWRQFPQAVGGRTAVPWAVRGNLLYSFGGSKSGEMLILDFDKRKMTTRETIGAEPPSVAMGAGMVAVGRYLIFVGGRGNSDWTFMYGCDVERMWWFVFHVMPDGATVSVADGAISPLGLFMLPRIHSCAMCYVHEQRKIVASLGHPEKDPPPIFVVACGEALAIINLREDMIAMFEAF